jgi:hypothetical protein
LGDDDGSPFLFPSATELPPGRRLTLYGGGHCDVETYRFSAGGRIGNGLQESDRILLIAPVGPDTLLDVRYVGGQVGASLVPDPERAGGWVPHNELYARVFSPGALERTEGTDPGPAGGPTEGPDAAPMPDEVGPAGPFLDHPMPNPFNRSTTLGYAVHGSEPRVTVYNILGQPVRSWSVTGGSGVHRRLDWNGCDDRGRTVASGVYLIEIRAGRHAYTARVSLLR